MSNDRTGKTMYLADGIEVHITEDMGDACLARKILLAEHYDDTGERYTVERDSDIGYYRNNELFATPPKDKYNDEITELKQDIRELNKQIKSLKTEKLNLKSECTRIEQTASRLAKKHEALTDLEAMLDGNFWGVVYFYCGRLKVGRPSDKRYSSEFDIIKTGVEFVFDTHRNVWKWVKRDNNSNDRARPFADEASALTYIKQKLSEYPSAIQHNHENYCKEYIANCDKYGVEPNPKWLAEYETKKAEASRKKLEKELAEYNRLRKYFGADE